MSTTTTNMGLILPADGDKADIQVVNNDLVLLDSWGERDRQSSNGIYPGRNIATIPELAEEVGDYGSVYAFLHARAQQKNATGLRVMDYMDVPQGVYGTRRWHLGHINPWEAFGDKELPYHFAFVDSAPVALPASDGYVTNGSYIMWNKTATNQGTSAQPCPYLASNLHAWELNNFLPSFPQELQNYMLNRREALEQRYSASGALNASTNWAWGDLGKVWSFSEVEVYGCVVWGTPGYTVATGRQLDYFRNIRNQLNGSRIHWWLRSVSGSSSSDVCRVDNGGYAGVTSAAHAWVRPRCGFLLG